MPSPVTLLTSFNPDAWKKNAWKGSNKKPIKNKDLWVKLDNLCKDNKIVWKWVKGHSSNKYNNLADELATKALI